MAPGTPTVSRAKRYRCWRASAASPRRPRSSTPSTARPRAEKVVKARRGKWFDPGLVDVLLAEARAGNVWKHLRSPALTQTLSGVEPTDQTLLATPERLDLVARAFARIIDAKSPFTYEHSGGVARVAVAMSRRMGFEGEELRDQMRAGLLHDLGKLGVSSRILDKPGALTEEEFARVKEHPGLSQEILCRVAPFRNIVERCANHHEKLDGSGYPRGLTARDLDLPTRILTVADIFDALTQSRPYRPGMSLEKTIAILDEEVRGPTLSPQRRHPEDPALRGRSTARLARYRSARYQWVRHTIESPGVFRRPRAFSLLEFGAV